ncbi:MAG: 6-phosphogluconolactonase [Desulfobacterales bacterium]|jgi:6-phosphogluconolactonase
MTPAENSRIIVTAGIEYLAVEGAELFQRIAVASVARTGLFTVAVSGGSTPRPMHRLLSEDPYRSGIPWQFTHLFWVDERLVPVTDPDSNFGSAERDFLNQLTIPAGNIHPMSSRKPPTAAADDYEHELRRHFSRFSNAEPVFDLIVLGVGEDGHTASIFPGDHSAEETTRWVTAVKGGTPYVERLTLTLPILNRARCIVYLISGSKKAVVVRSLLLDASAQLPPQRIAPQRGEIIWLLDTEAAELLPQDLPKCIRKK